MNMTDVDAVLKELGEDPSQCMETPETRRVHRDGLDIEIFDDGGDLACVATLCELGSDLDGVYAALNTLAPARNARVFEADNYLRVKTTAAGRTLREMIEDAIARAKDADVQSIKSKFRNWD